jgi:hypothetical protein
MVGRLSGIWPRVGFSVFLFFFLFMFFLFHFSFSFLFSIWNTQTKFKFLFWISYSQSQLYNPNPTIFNILFSFHYLILAIIDDYYNFLSHFLFYIFIYNLRSNLSYVFNKMHPNKITSKRCTFLYLFIGCLTNLISLIDYKKEGS